MRRSPCACVWHLAYGVLQVLLPLNEYTFFYFCLRRGQADGDKGRRTLLHQAVKQSLPGLVSDTVRDDAGDICVRIYRKGQVIDWDPVWVSQVFKNWVRRPRHFVLFWVHAKHKQDSTWPGVAEPIRI
jgi:hypothetical protein